MTMRLAPPGGQQGDRQGGAGVARSVKAGDRVWSFRRLWWVSLRKYGKQGLKKKADTGIFISFIC